jgi:23S rRNA A1618 N6-methylase RlmF
LFCSGTGASCIFPLLGAKFLKWKFIGTDIDQESLKFAQENVEKNALSEMIELRVGSDENILIADLDFTFCMCNPPFFDDQYPEDLGGSSSSVHPLRGEIEATKSELKYPGGEVAFVTRMFEESTQLKMKYRWFTSMLGKKASIKPLQTLMFQGSAKVVRIEEFIQGRQARWGIAWTFCEDIVQAIRNPKAKKA